MYIELSNLPSRGNSVLPRDDALNINLLTVDNVLELSECPEEMFDDLYEQQIDNSITNYNLTEFTSSDVLYLKLWHKINSFPGGDIYKARIDCPECKEEDVEVDVHLTNIDIDPLVNYKEQVLEDFGKIKVPTYQNVLQARVQKLEYSNIPMFMLTIFNCIEGKTFEECLQIFNDIYKPDRNKAISFIKQTKSQMQSFSHGISPIVTVICTKCKKEVRLRLNFNNNFFSI